MKHRNLFFGENYYVYFANIIYKWLMTRNWVTNSDVMAEYLGYNSAAELPCPISKCNHIKELTKALSDIKREIGIDNFEEDGNNRNKRIRYIGKDDDPLAEMRKAKVIEDLKLYWKFCQDSAGFFPSSWLEYFFKDSRDLLDIKTRHKKGEQVLSASLDRMLTNIEYLPSLYMAIINKYVLSIDYKPYNEEMRTVVIHPHYLKEFNGRWFLFGYAEGQDPELGYNIALDRICAKPREQYKVEYQSAPQGFYDEFFKNIVGVSHIKDKDGQPYPVKGIHIRAHSLYIYKLMETKKIHPSQIVSIPFEEHEDGAYGEFIVNVELNNEFIGRILQMGAGLEVVAPEEIRQVFKIRVGELAKLYD